MGGDWQWGVIIDAGSSGTRAYIYKWKDVLTARPPDGPDGSTSLPELALATVEKNRPGISTFAGRPADVGEHLQPLIDAAITEIPSGKISETPIFVMATAGMRLVPEAQRVSILQQTCSYLRRKTDFYLPDCDRHIRVIPGETEGLYGWLAANYLLGGFNDESNGDDGTHQNTHGFLDMGGASTQVVFSPNATEAAEHHDDLRLVRLRTIDGTAKEYKVFSTSFLGFGARVARQRYVEDLEERYSTNSTNMLPDPCMPNGLRTTTNGESVALDDAPPGGKMLVGTGDFQECLRQTFPLLRKDAQCEDFPCLFNGQHAPGIDFDVTRFVGVSEYWHVTNGVFSSPGSKSYDLTTYKEKAIKFCNQDWLEIYQSLVPRKKDSARKVQDAQQLCFKASWFINVLYNGIGVPIGTLDETIATSPNSPNETVPNSQGGTINHFTPVNKIHGTELSWTLGAMLLYVSGLIPPIGDSLPVGFGPNVAGTSTEFEVWGPSPKMNDIGSTHTHSTKTHGAPRIGILALVIVGIAFLILLLCGRDGRARLYRKLTAKARRRRRSSGHGVRNWAKTFSRRFFGREPVIYERILEEGPRGELGPVDIYPYDSDDSTVSQPSPSLGLSLGLRTFKDGNERIGERTIDASIDRSGLAVRTESRDRLTPTGQMLGVGRRSRASSPTRLNSPSMAMTREF